MWRDFREFADLPEFRAIVDQHQTRVKSIVRARRFEAVLKKPEMGGSYGFVVHKLEDHNNILVIDEIKMGGILDTWNRGTHRLRKKRSRIQPLAVIVQVNGASDHHSFMTQQLMEPQVALHVVNPPTVADVVRIYDLLKDGGMHPQPFWELGDVGAGSQLSMELAQMLDHARFGAPVTEKNRQPLPEFPGPHIDRRPQGGSVSRQQLPEFSGTVPCNDEHGGPDPGTDRERGCLGADGARRVEECLQGPPVTCGGSQGYAGGRRRNLF